jgi:hypothetical protein
MTRAEQRAVDARIAALEQERDQLGALVQWYAASRQRWMETVERGSALIYRQTGGRLTGPDEEIPSPVGCLDRPDLKMAPVEYERSEEVDDLADYARDINRW